MGVKLSRSQDDLGRTQSSLIAPSVDCNFPEGDIRPATAESKQFPSSAYSARSAVPRFPDRDFAGADGIPPLRFERQDDRISRPSRYAGARAERVHDREKSPVSVGRLRGTVVSSRARRPTKFRVVLETRRWRHESGFRLYGVDWARRVSDDQGIFLPD